MHITPTAPALIDATVEGEEGDAKPSYWGTITDGDNDILSYYCVKALIYYVKKNTLNAICYH
jgi:hypothetical protein